MRFSEISVEFINTISILNLRVRQLKSRLCCISNFTLKYLNFIYILHLVFNCSADIVRSTHTHTHTRVRSNECTKTNRKYTHSNSTHLLKINAIFLHLLDFLISPFEYMFNVVLVHLINKFRANIKPLVTAIK